MKDLNKELSDISLKELYKFRSILNIIINNRIETERLEDDNECDATESDIY